MNSLASYRKCAARIRERWPGFLELRESRLAQEQRHGQAAEKVAENIAEDLFTGVLDWKISDLNNQIGYADIILTRLGIKYLVIEVKRPRALARRKTALDAALDQARGYADERLMTWRDPGKLLMALASILPSTKGEFTSYSTSLIFRAVWRLTSL